MKTQDILPIPDFYADIVSERSAAGYHIGMDFHQFFQTISKNFIYQRFDIDLSVIKKDVWVVEFFFLVNIILIGRLLLGIIR